MVEYLIIGWAVILGLLIGGAMTKAISRKVVMQARQQAQSLVAEAREAAAQAVREMGARAREEALGLRRSSEAQQRQAEEENALLEERATKLEARNEKLEAECAVRETQLARRDQAARQLKAEAASARQQAKERRRQAAQMLEERAGKTAGEMRQGLVETLVEEHRALCADRLRNLEGTESEELTRQAKRLMGIAMGRYRWRLAIDRLTFLVSLPEEDAVRLAGHPEHLQFIEDRCGVHLAPTDNGGYLRMEGGDGVARELCRRALTRFAAEKKVRDAERLLQSITEELQREISGRGQEAFEILGLDPTPPELVTLTGKLVFRTSYSQNQWEHAIESAYLAGLMAVELGLDIRLARRATLLHDIGKALSHEVEGSHALIGAEIAQRHGEPEILVQAISSHHGDEPSRSPYAHLVAAADAMSGARPGARREMIEAYVDRIGDLERIASRFPGVSAVHAVQAGREIRIHVDEERVSDSRAAQLSEEIAKVISSELTFPGQIRITVIREFKAVELA